MFSSPKHFLRILQDDRTEPVWLRRVGMPSTRSGVRIAPWHPGSGRRQVSRARRLQMPFMWRMLADIHNGQAVPARSGCKGLATDGVGTWATDGAATWVRALRERPMMKEFSMKAQAEPLPTQPIPPQPPPAPYPSSPKPPPLPPTEPTPEPRREPPLPEAPPPVDDPPPGDGPVIPAVI